MTVQQLKYILKVAEVGSITEAAKLLLYHSQVCPIPSKKRKKRLVSVFLRSRTRITLTKMVLNFSVIMRRVIQQMELLEDRYVKIFRESDIWSIFSALYFYGKRFCGVS